MPTDKAVKYSFRINYHVTILVALLCVITDLQVAKIDNVTKEFNLKKYSISVARLFCSRSYNWIKRLYANLDNYQYDEISLFYFLIGDWIYFSEVKRKDLSELRLKAINIQKKIDTMNGDIQIANVNPLKFNSFISLTLVATGILNKLKIKSNRLETFTRNLPNVLARYYAKIPIEKINLFLLSFLLNKIGVRNDLNLGIQIPIREKDMKSLHIDRDIINNLGDYILAKRLITKKEVSFKQYPYDNIHTIIPLSLSNSIRNYDLNLILKLLRTMKYLNKTHTHPFKQALDFVIEQQNHEGRFGFCLPEISQLRMIDHKFNYTMELYLPLTFSALWTVIEVINDRFILFDDFIKTPTI